MKMTAVVSTAVALWGLVCFGGPEVAELVGLSVSVAAAIVAVVSWGITIGRELSK